MSAVTFVRRLDVTVRIAEGDGLLVETLIGRYVLDRDARTVWERIDGAASGSQIADQVASETGLSPDDVRDQVAAALRHFEELGLIERSAPRAGGS